VRQRLGLPEWEPGDAQDRRVNPATSRQFDWSAVDRQAEYRERTEDDLIRINRAVAIWEAAVDPRDTLAERYVREHRKLNLQEDIAKGVLRFHSRCPWRNEDTGKIVFVSALIAAFRSIDDDAITAIHRIRLNPDGSKHSRRMLGIVHRAAVKISGNVDGELAIGEGIESCMAARQLGIQSPCWALGSCGAISFFPVLPDVMTLRILGEIDDANAKAARFCGRRWRRAGRNVVRLLPEIGQDLNDEIIARTGS